MRRTSPLRVLAIASLACLCARVVSADIIDRLLAVVAGQTVTQSDLNAVRMLQLLPAPASGDPVGGYLDEMIDRDLMLTEVDRYVPPEPAPEEIDRHLAQVRERAGGDAALQHTLTVTGMTMDQLRRWIRDDLRIQTYLNQRFGTSDPTARARLVSEWVAGLRRRTDVTVLYIAP